ncbi:hypothetical protein B0J17DRAFT_717053 [Rhizoctonia solani]|nr:hypothetical protein B0J17DRAFT_717053 [Rhizoctonia solani]
MFTTTPRRLLEIFSPGFDSKSSTSRSHYSFAPEQLFYALTFTYDPEKHVESTIVKSVWYGKQTKSVQHEFILIEVEDPKASLKNYMSRKKAAGSSQSCRGLAMDAFRVSYNGNESQLLQEYQLLPRQYLEKIEFSHKNSLFLYQLVTLVHIVSEKSPHYALGYRNCYWFAGLIWECLRSLRPDAQYDGRLSQKRGKITILLYTPEEKDKRDICNEFEKAIQEVETNLSASRKLWRRTMRALTMSLQPGLPDCLSDPEESGLNESPRDLVEGNSVYLGSAGLIETSTPNTTPVRDTLISSAVSKHSSGRENWSVCRVQ